MAKKSKSSSAPRVRAPGFGVIISAIVMALMCFLFADYLLYRPCDADEEPNFLQGYGNIN